MPSCKPTIVPAAIAYMAEHGSQTAASLAAALGFDLSAVRKAMMNAVDAGQVDIVRRERTQHGNDRLHYGLPQPKTYPSIRGGEYRAWMPSGTPPQWIEGATP